MAGLTELVEGVELVSLDAGNTIVYFDPAAAAEAARTAGFDFEPAALDQAFGPAKRALESRATAPPFDDPEIPPTWSGFMCTLVECAGGLTRTDSAVCVRALWRAHREYNLWRRVPEGLMDAIAEVRRAGIPVCVVSNSEGRLEQLFRDIGILDAFDRVVDSHHAGVEKPDPRIFRHVLDAFAIAPDRALHAGDVYAADVVGAHAAGMRAVLIDPEDHYAGVHEDVPRVRQTVELLRAVLAARRG